MVGQPSQHLCKVAKHVCLVGKLATAAPLFPSCRYHSMSDLGAIAADALAAWLLAAGSGQPHQRLEPVLASPTPSANLLEQASVNGTDATVSGEKQPVSAS